MKKISKKGNLRTRRRIRKTVAALFMATAIVVAALPVENTGKATYAKTTAKGAVNLDEVYKDYQTYYYNSANYGDYYFGSDYTSKYNGYTKVTYNTKTSNEKITCTISQGGTLDWTYIYKDYVDATLNQTTGIIVGYNSSKVSDSVTIESTAYKDAWIITPGLRTAFKNTIASESYVFSVDKSQTVDVYAKDGTNLTIPTTITPTGPVFTSISNTTIPLTATSENGLYASTGGTKSLYDLWYKDSSFTAESTTNDVVAEFCSKIADYQTWLNKINEYNTQQDLLVKKIQSADTATDCSNDLTNLKQLYFDNVSPNQTFNVNSFSDNVLNDYICKRVSIEADSNTTIQLDDYELTRVTDKIHYGTASDDYYSYIPTLKSESNSSNGNCHDLVNNKYYLMVGSITLGGIGNAIFKNDKKITGMTLASSFTFIGNSAFQETNLTSISMTNANIIGNKAFYGCTSLSDVNFINENNASGVNYIGAQAFDGCTALKNIELPNSVTNILPGAFANCTSLEKLDFLITSSMNIWPFAFLNATGLKECNFPDSLSGTLIMGLACFANSGTAGGGALSDFEFPSYMTKIQAGTTDFEKTAGDFFTICNGKGYGVGKNHNNEFMYNYILGGRSNLTHVTFPANLGGNLETGTYVRIPDDTLYSCRGLEYVTFGSCDTSTFTSQACVGLTYDTPVNDSSVDDDGHTLFQDVNVETFYVEGPGLYSDGKKANPRVVTYGAETAANDSIPYRFFDKDGKETMEVSNGEYISNFLIDNGAAMLQGYSLLDPSNKNPLGEIKIPEKVCGYTIKTIEKGCFDAINDQVQILTISDGLNIAIEDNAFKDCTDLRIVNIGNGVTAIGESAFEGCKALENVYFNQPVSVTEQSESEDWYDALVIGKNAFATNSEYLTFHGPIHSGYQPFEYAMDKNLIASNRNICYKTDEPTNFTVIRDNATGLATLIDYPHYEDIDLQNTNATEVEKKDNGVTTYSLVESWENKNGVRNHTTYNNLSIRNDSIQAVEDTLFLDIPDGVESVDTYSFYSNDGVNSQNFSYATRYYYKDQTTHPKYEVKTGSGNYYDILGKNDNSYDLRNINYYSNDYRNVKRLYFDKSYFDSTLESVADQYWNSKDSKDTAPIGLFNGHFYDKEEYNSTVTYPIVSTGTLTKTKTNTIGVIGSTLSFSLRDIPTHSMIEKLVRGNDELLQVSFGSLLDLPDYAFYSCENLIYADLGPYFGEPTTNSKGETVYPDTVVLPFAGCENMDGITFGGKTENDNYIYANGILYRKGLGESVNGIPEGKLQIVEVLEGRGNTDFNSSEYDYNIAGTAINASYDPLLKDVVSIADGAFRNNPYLTTVDLSETQIAKIPDYCFYNDTGLANIELPTTLESIGEYAFIGSKKGKQISFGSQYVNIAESAFDSNSGATFYGDAYSDTERTHASPIKTYADKYSYIEFVTISSYQIKLYNYNADLLDIRYLQVDDGEKNGGSIDDKTLSNLEKEKCVRNGYTFTGWAWDKDGDLSTTNDVITDQETVLNGIKENRTLVAQYDVNGVVSDGKEYTLTVENGTVLTTGKTTATIVSGSPVAVIANNPATGYAFSRWNSKEITLDDNNRFNSKLTFIMPNSDATITAVYGDGNGNSSSDSSATNGSGSNNNNNNNNNNSSTDTTTKYALTVNYGSGSGEYAAGTVVTITAYAPTSNNKVFSKWTAGTTNVAFANATSATTTLVMPASAETVTANYKTRTSDDDDDEADAITRRTQNGTTTGTTTVNTVTGTVPTTTTDTTVTNTNTGDKLYINKNGVSNKDVGSANVEGSTDNFIVRITDSDEATAAAQEALRNRFGSLDGIVYFPMDISLYDSTGTYKIQDTYGLDVSVTMPIPDTLIQYGGNAKIAAADNGYLQNLNAKFTTIDGIACMTFTPPHFSPYVIYVDTNNLIAGQTFDKTPQTGDPIHPKWFLAAGFACMSIFLFVKGDRKKKIPVRA